MDKIITLSTKQIQIEVLKRFIEAAGKEHKNKEVGGILQEPYIDHRVNTKWR